MNLTLTSCWMIRARKLTLSWPELSWFWSWCGFSVILSCVALDFGRLSWVWVDLISGWFRLISWGESHFSVLTTFWVDLVRFRIDFTPLSWFWVRAELTSGLWCNFSELWFWWFLSWFGLWVDFLWFWLKFGWFSWVNFGCWVWVEFDSFSWFYLDFGIVSWVWLIISVSESMLTRSHFWVDFDLILTSWVDVDPGLSF